MGLCTDVLKEQFLEGKATWKKTFFISQHWSAIKEVRLFPSLFRKVSFLKPCYVVIYATYVATYKKIEICLLNYILMQFLFSNPNLLRKKRYSDHVLNAILEQILYSNLFILAKKGHWNWGRWLEPLKKYPVLLKNLSIKNGFSGQIFD